MHLYTEAKAIAQEAWEESEFDQDDRAGIYISIM